MVLALNATGHSIYCVVWTVLTHPPLFPFISRFQSCSVRPFPAFTFLSELSIGLRLRSFSLAFAIL